MTVSSGKGGPLHRSTGPGMTRETQVPLTLASGSHSSPDGKANWERQDL